MPAQLKILKAIFYLSLRNFELILGALIRSSFLFLHAQFKFIGCLLNYLYIMQSMQVIIVYYSVQFYLIRKFCFRFRKFFDESSDRDRK